MPEPRSSTPNLGGNGLVLLLLAAAGTYFVTHQVPLEGNRPPTSETYIREQGRVQDVESRLWQDPFAAVAERLTKAELTPEKCKNDPNEELVDHCRSLLSRYDYNGPLPIVVVASVSGAPYSEDHEFRRRARYAILAGLSQEGLTPENPQHIGFYWPSAAAKFETQLPQAVPFEWFRPNNGNGKPVLLLWFDEDVLGKRPLKQFDEFFCRSLASGAYRAPIPWSRATILGPQQSSTLSSMAKEGGDDLTKRRCADDIRPHFFVYSATVADANVIPADFRSSCSSSCLSGYFKDKQHVDLHRMTATDDALARTIRDELARRGVVNEPSKDRNSHIVLVSEWDTFYGQSLPGSIAGCLAATAGKSRENDAKKHNGCAEIDRRFRHSYSYLRGLDGQMPNVDGLGSAKAAKGSDAKQDANSQDKEKEGNKFWSYAKPNDRAEGQGQFDYLRRLGDVVQELDAELRTTEGDHIKAVGILGSDRFDKLLLLQALRPILPEAVFFTTDLDAVFLSPTALPYTHNLLIASSFGLRLRNELQCGIPPFRSSYQTAAYLAGRNAVHGLEGPPRPWLAPPLLFEVGNSRLFQFPTDGEPSSSKNEAADQARCDNGPLVFADIHPTAAHMFPQAGVAGAFALAVALSGLVVGAALCCGPGRRLIWRGVGAFQRVPGSDFLRGTGILVVFCLVAAAAFGLIYFAWPPLARWLTDQGQPMIWFEGIGVWPTIVMRGATLLLCVLLFYHAFIALNANMERISKKLLIADKWDKAAKDRKSADRSWLKDASHSFYMSAHDTAPDGNGNFFWRKYIFQGDFRSRLVRVGAGVAVMFALWGILYAVFGNSPAPARGAISFWLYRTVTILLVAATLFLIFFVADTTFLCWRAIRELRAKKSIWPEETLDDFSKRFGLPKEDIDDWIDLTFISWRTECITWLIYSPFLIIALLVFSRSQLFANFGPSIPDLITMTVGVLIVVACAVALRLAAEKSRDEALRRLHESIILAKRSEKGTRRADQLSALVERIEHLHDGAFSPFSQQPLIRAMLLPLGSFGGVALLEYLMLPGGLS